MAFEIPFTAQEIQEVATPVSDEVLILALRCGSTALSEFAEKEMEPVFRGLIALTHEEDAIGRRSIG